MLSHPLFLGRTVVLTLTSFLPEKVLDVLRCRVVPLFYHVNTGRFLLTSLECCHHRIPERVTHSSHGKQWKQTETVRNRFWLDRDHQYQSESGQKILETGYCQESGLLKNFKRRRIQRKFLKNLKGKPHMSSVSTIHWYFFQTNLIIWDCLSNQCTFPALFLYLPPPHVLALVVL